MGEWRPRETAPTEEGDEFLSVDVFKNAIGEPTATYEVTRCLFVDENGPWWVGVDTSRIQFTHWMPLPAPPPIPDCV